MAREPSKRCAARGQRLAHAYIRAAGAHDGQEIVAQPDAVQDPEAVRLEVEEVRAAEATRARRFPPCLGTAHP